MNNLLRVGDGVRENDEALAWSLFDVVVQVERLVFLDADRLQLDEVARDEHRLSEIDDFVLVGELHFVHKRLHFGNHFLVFLLTVLTAVLSLLLALSVRLLLLLL